MDLSRLHGRADHTIQSGLGRVGSISHDGLLHRSGDQQFLLHSRLAGGRQLGHRNHQGTRAVRSGYPFQRTLHHRPGARCVKVYHIHVQSGQNRHGLFYCVGNIMEFQVQKDLMPPCLNLPHNGRAFGIKQLHADFDIGLSPRKLVQKCQGLCFAAEIAGYDHIFSHLWAPPMISLIS